jgi:S-(hydroxymethyl)glutathione synthase
MLSVTTKLHIHAAPHTVWSLLDDLPRYPEWNPLTPDLTGRTTVGSVLRGTLTKPGASNVPIAPTLMAAIGARELRWLTDAPGFRAEHYLRLIPTPDGGTDLIHGEDFEGPIAEERRAGIEATSPPAFALMNEALKARAEQQKNVTITLHPALDDVSTATPITTLACHCPKDRVEVVLTGAVYHNHLCGCSQCWKPQGALFAMTAVVSQDRLQVQSHGEKLTILDNNSPVRRRLCLECGVHLYGTPLDPDHHVFGLCFIHPELAVTGSAGRPEFAGFVSSLIESGTHPAQMFAIRAMLSRQNIPAHDAFSPELMDVIAWHRRKLREHPFLTG